jgi:phosphatidylserine/phosphatidylglycerophosphate/cardiolipin synthase-like enzyme
MDEYLTANAFLTPCYISLNFYLSSIIYVPLMQASAKGPRQPWHDLHCKIDGPASYDVLKNFEQRWRKASKFRDRFRKVSRWKDDALIKLERISWILSPSANVPNDHISLRVSKEEDPENWHVQVFRSIDSGSLKGFPSESKEASKQVSLLHVHFYFYCGNIGNILLTMFSKSIAMLKFVVLIFRKILHPLFLCHTKICFGIQFLII